MLERSIFRYSFIVNWFSVLTARPKSFFFICAAFLGCALSCLFFTGCASYDYAHNVKMIAFSEDIKKGQSIGNIRGEDCTMMVLGYYLGGMPTVDRAFINARQGANAIHSVGFDFKNEGRGTDSLKYVTNVTTQQEGFNAVLFGKTCLVVTGVGYR